jgi:hypothetical protein
MIAEERVAYFGDDHLAPRIVLQLCEKLCRAQQRYEIGKVGLEPRKEIFGCFHSGEDRSRCEQSAVESFVLSEE